MLEARNRDPIAAGDGGARQGGEAVSQQVSGRFTRSDDKIPKERVVGLMKHVPNGHEERKNSQGWGPRTHERKSRANSRQSCDLIVRAMEKEESENLGIQCELSNWKSSCYQVGESCDRSVRAEKVLQQAEKNKDSATQKEVPQVEEKEVEKSPDDDDDDVIS